MISDTLKTFEPRHILVPYPAKSPVNRNSWDTSVKHYFRLGLEKNIPSELRKEIPSSNISRWKQESNDKYKGCDIAVFISQEIELLQRFNQSHRIKKILLGYLKLTDTLHNILRNVHGIKSTLKEHKELIVNTIESLYSTIPVDHALRIFNLSRSSYQNYKSIVIHKCDHSYFHWCIKRFKNQLLPREVLTIKNYLKHDDYKFWSKSSIYLKAVREGSLSCGLSTFYKYCRLLGFSNQKGLFKPGKYNPLITTRSNEVWCADVTIFKTLNGSKWYIHILMDHFSKKILGYRIENSSSGKAIRELLSDAYQKYRPIDTMFLTDAGSENINHNVEALIDSFKGKIDHRVAQRDVLFSNSMIEAFNRVLKYQFLYPYPIHNRKKLETLLAKSITIYNDCRPQWNLKGNTPSEMFDGNTILISDYTKDSKAQKAIRLAENKKKTCKSCL